MNELQLKAAKKAGLAVLVAVCVVLLFRMSPMLAIMLVFLVGIGTGSYMFFMDVEEQKIFREEHEKAMEKLRKEREEALDRIRR